VITWTRTDFPFSALRCGPPGLATLSCIGPVMYLFHQLSSVSADDMGDREIQWKEQWMMGQRDWTWSPASLMSSVTFRIVVITS
jgi:hypothetical protein